MSYCWKEDDFIDGLFWWISDDESRPFVALRVGDHDKYGRPWRASLKCPHHSPDHQATTPGMGEARDALQLLEIMLVFAGSVRDAEMVADARRAFDTSADYRKGRVI